MAHGVAERNNGGVEGAERKKTPKKSLMKSLNFSTLD